MDILRQDLELNKLNFKIDRTLAAQTAFIDKMKSIHGDRYDYSLVDFKLNDLIIAMSNNNDLSSEHSKYAHRQRRPPIEQIHFRCQQ